ncbi:DUF2169 domain-containing protein [Chondromyces crocatus]|uniref:DUF2169 domain-containing protein n=1 Tax=Chondromyces crocatus TaxID=52 RepID=UPI0014704A51|nr:DUF2169 domain-containing protein [Chondromyces crocatus]
MSWAAVGVNPTLDRSGRDVAVVVAKVAYRVSPEGVVRRVLAPVRRDDVRDEGGGVRFPGDLTADEKPGTDVGLVGVAHPPLRGGGGPRGRSFAWLSVGGLRKVITVHGPRVYVKGWRGVAPSEPGPLVDPVPLRYDLAYGGSDPLTGAVEALNPIGMGFSSDPLRLIGLPVPPLGLAEETEGVTSGPPAHATFAPIPAQWEPRRSLAGTHDAAWARERAPVRPRDFDPRHHAWSTPGLYSAAPLVGDEPVEVGGVLPEGTWRFRLPSYAVAFESVCEGRHEVHATHLDSFLIDSETRAVELCWRASIRLPKKWERLERILVLGVGELSEEVLRGQGPPAGKRSGERAQVGAGVGGEGKP